MTNLDKYEAVNKCETFDELAAVILSFADKDGMIQGRAEKFDAKKMAIACTELANLKNKVLLALYSRNLTRKWGIRQQALYIKIFTR